MAFPVSRLEFAQLMADEVCPDCNNGTFSGDDNTLRCGNCGVTFVLEPPPKKLRDLDLLAVIARMVKGPVNCGPERYQDFLEGLSSLVTTFCGGSVLEVAPTEIGDWTATIRFDDQVKDGSIFASFDPAHPWPV